MRGFVVWLAVTVLVAAVLLRVTGLDASPDRQPGELAARASGRGGADAFLACSFAIAITLPVAWWVRRRQRHPRA